MAIYLIDYENVYIEGLNGLESLKAEDEVIIFYTQNRCGLTFELHQRLISSRAKVHLMEVTALSTRKNTIKNALDLQLSMYIGYLVGSRPGIPLHIISKDTDFDLDLAFYAQYLNGDMKKLSICATIENALQGVTMPVEATAPVTEPQSPTKQKAGRGQGVFPDGLQRQVSGLLGTEDTRLIRRVCAAITAAEDLLALNNLLSRYYHDGKQVKEIYHKLKPSFHALREAALSEA